MSDFVFLHGGGQGGWVWDECIAAMRLQAGDAFRALALDVPGCGAKRDRDVAGMTFDELTADLIADVEGSGSADSVLIGHSQAGTVLPRMVEMRPELLSHLVYVTCSAPPPGMTTIEQMGDGVHGQHDDQIGWPVDPGTSTMEERLRAMFCNDMSPADTEAFFARLGRDAWPPVSYAERAWRHDHLAAIPATYVQCLRDMSLPPSWQETIARRLKVDATVHIDAGHQVMNTRPHALAEVLLQLSNKPC